MEKLAIVVATADAQGDAEPEGYAGDPDPARKEIVDIAKFLVCKELGLLRAESYGPECPSEWSSFMANLMFLEDRRIDPQEREVEQVQAQLTYDWIALGNGLYRIMAKPTGRDIIGWYADVELAWTDGVWVATVRETNSLLPHSEIGDIAIVAVCA